jgi:hypothetical protein
MVCSSGAVDRRRAMRRRCKEESATVLLYSRELPGGGVVTIEASPESEGKNYTGRVLVERRVDVRRRLGHAPPVIAEAAGETPTVLFRQLYAIASDNVEIARGLIRLQSRKRDD